MSINKTIPYDAILKVSRILEIHDALFYKLWEMGTPILSNKINTACVQWNNKGNLISFLFNPKFWNKLNDYERAFVIAHEALHVLLSHGSRIKPKNKCEEKTANIAMDIAVNEMLLKGFRFELDKLQNCPKLCLCDTVFKGMNVNKDRSFGYYYRLLIKDIETVNRNGTLDNHEGLVGVPEDILDQIADALCVDTTITSEEREQFSKNVAADSTGSEVEASGKRGTETVPSFLKRIINPPKYHKPKKCWRDLVKDLVCKIMKEKEDENDQWAKTSRRLSCFHPDFYLPYEERSTRKVKDKHEAWFFLDNSGSCDQESKLFFGAYKTVPKKYFETRLFAFDTEVTEIDKEKGEFPYGGGTSFSCIEKFIRKEIARRNIEYPEVVFVLTDGYGDRVNPHFPDRWVWINTTDCDNCIPKQSGVHRFQDMGFISRKENT